MKQVQVDGFGDLDHLQLIDAPDPTPGDGEVVIEIAACSLNFSDLLQRQGIYVGGPRPPFVPGVEAAGTVIAHGPNVSEPALGARVIALARGGLHAGRAAVSAASCIALPDSLDFIAGAAFPISFLTAYHALTTVAHSVAGELVVVHAAAGGVGTAAVQIAKLLDLRVLATASTDDKRAKLLSLGADLISGYEGFDAIARDCGGAAIVLDSIGGDVCQRSLRILTPLGRLVAIGASSGDVRPIDLVKLMFTSRAVLGLHLDAILSRADLLAPSLDWLFARIAAGELAIQVGQPLPLADIRRAHELLASRASYGKIVLVP
jgi:NADPH2:quinone reductase